MKYKVKHDVTKIDGFKSASFRYLLEHFKCVVSALDISLDNNIKNGTPLLFHYNGNTYNSRDKIPVSLYSESMKDVVIELYNPEIKKGEDMMNCNNTTNNYNAKETNDMGTIVYLLSIIKLIVICFSLYSVLDRVCESYDRSSSFTETISKGFEDDPKHEKKIIFKRDGGGGL